MLNNLKTTIEDNFKFRLNKNQLAETERLIFEIIKREKINLKKLLIFLKKNSNIDKCSSGKKFSTLKQTLLELRFPLTQAAERIDAQRVFLNKLKNPLKDNWQVNKDFKPLKIFVETKVKESYIINNLRKKFPKIETEEVTSCAEYIKKNKFTVSELKKPFIFVVKENCDFIKICPCTKGHLYCGYWIFNLGFGCPFDCSYCFLQQYSNFPGITLPANLDNFFERCDEFLAQFKKPLRIGTGEFCDSLALDDITEYSKKIIPYFAKKNVLFELKTKSSSIDNLLKITPPSNIVISWSLNPQSIIKTEEKATASLKLRLEAAKKVQATGFRVGFHFDPIIHIKDWPKLYKEVIDKLYAYCEPPFSWISLGTLRCHRELKGISQVRFPKSDIFYGELLLGKDKKLRYPNFLKVEIYQKMLEFIRRHDKKTPIYLCMEDNEVWSRVKGLVPFSEIENSLAKL